MSADDKKSELDFQKKFLMVNSHEKRLRQIELLFFRKDVDSGSDLYNDLSKMIKH